MQIEGGCYCGEVRYAVEGEPLFKALCYCRECQHIAGGSPNVVMGVPEAGFAYREGAAKSFRRSDLERPVTREFCPRCGTHLLTRAPGLPGVVLLKVGTFDDPSLFGRPQMAIFTGEKQGFHVLPEGVAAFERSPR
jgi:hypothetical protein